MKLELLRQLSNARAISGQEEAARALILEAIDGHVEDVRVDALGNVLALKPGSQGADLPRTLVTAHMDEVGFVVRSVDGEGLLRFYSVGGVDARILPGLRVCVGADGLARRDHVEAHSPRPRAENPAAGQPAHRHRRA